MSRPIITVDNLSKAYRLGQQDEKYPSFREALVGAAKAPFKRFQRLSGRGSEDELFWALKDVSFEVNQGDVVGIIGRNGAGKSTLLKVLSRITEPTTGRAVLRGRVASLLEVGTGFHPELSGRENIYLNGSILGMKKTEIDRKFDEIVAFAEVERFLDTPVKRYSSGMYVRLAFAVAAHLEPEILIVDEVLAVGDAQFQKKCLGKMQEVSQGQGRTVLFVSHNMAAVERLCNRGVLLAKGQVVLEGGTDECVRQYMELHYDANRTSYQADEKAVADDDSRVVLKEARIEKHASSSPSVLLFGEPFSITTRWHHREYVPNLSYGLRVFDTRENLVVVLNTISDSSIDLSDAGERTVKCAVDTNILPPGKYRIAVGAFTRPYGTVTDVNDCLYIEVLETPYSEDWKFTAANRPAAAVPVAWNVELEPQPQP
ncbi:ABC transporter ATP-binding protein [Aeoliella mucimassa]|uniref:Teichoic acids export ATP-binding protein TagH n=1 Tax=Aeoliella mucimassa TaxID=2527972 RepID=A0A518AQB2_9BACT|nr:ABC transporter ATP-binding protein [Aeoliella mucimassa]QDU56904.1 Teichoic acids export ATP-binding protein TagH [Aeoliella mucimassa]